LPTDYFVNKIKRNVWIATMV